jgi:uncharacterized protein (TIGR03790 family)
MTASASRFSLLLLLAWVAAPAGAQTERLRTTREAAATLVIFNVRDPESRALADYYAERRAIPPEQIIGLDCPQGEEITRQQYIDTIEAPLRRLFERKKWWDIRNAFDDENEVKGSFIRYVALMRGMPLKVQTTIVPPAPDKPAPPRPNNDNGINGRDEASVDSEIAVLGDNKVERFGMVVNPYFRRFTPILDSAVTSGLLLVCRLDAPSADTVRRMIDDSLYAERYGLHGWAYVDRRSIPDEKYKLGDEWLQNLATECWNNGIPVILDNMPAVFPAGFAITDAALYYGWYDWAAGGAMGPPYLRFRRGAVAVHIHSFSASTLRDPQANWVAPLLTRGVAATIGNVYEPYLDLTAHLDIFNERLLKGFTFAESAYMSQPTLSWMNVAVGDPLYRPFPAADIRNWNRETEDDAAPWLALEKNLLRAKRNPLAQTLSLAKLAQQSGSPLDYEALGMLQSFTGEPREAIASLEAAGSLYQSPPEAFRTIIERVRILQSIGDKTTALKLIDRATQRAQPPERAKLLADLRTEISPPPSPSPTATDKKP